jgi:hypothetical protein
MIALAPENKLNAVKKAIENCGGQILGVKTNAEGVRVDPTSPKASRGREMKL